MTRILCEAGAEIDLRDKDGEHTVHLGRRYARLYGNSSLPAMPRQRPCWQMHRCWPWSAGYTPLHMASGYLHTPVVELLLAYGADPEVLPRTSRMSLAPPRSDVNDGCPSA